MVECAVSLNSFSIPSSQPLAVFGEPGNCALGKDAQSMKKL